MAALTIHELLTGYCAVLKRKRLKYRRNTTRARVFTALARASYRSSPTDVWRGINHSGDGCNVTWSYFIRLAREYRRANT